MDVSPQQPGHDRRELARGLQLQQEMEVVGHQTIMKKSEGVALAIACEQTQENGAVFVIGEDGRAVVAAIEDMITGGIGPQMAAWDAWNGKFPPANTGGSVLSF